MMAAQAQPARPALLSVDVVEHKSTRSFHGCSNLTPTLPLSGVLVGHDRNRGTTAPPSQTAAARSTLPSPSTLPLVATTWHRCRSVDEPATGARNCLPARPPLVPPLLQLSLAFAPSIWSRSATAPAPGQARLTESSAASTAAVSSRSARLRRRLRWAGSSSSCRTHRPKPRSGPHPPLRPGGPAACGRRGRTAEAAEASPGTTLERRLCSE